MGVISESTGNQLHVQKACQTGDMSEDANIERMTSAKTI